MPNIPKIKCDSSPLSLLKSRLAIPCNRVSYIENHGRYKFHLIEKKFHCHLTSSYRTIPHLSSDLPSMGRDTGEAQECVALRHENGPGSHSAGEQIMWTLYMQLIIFLINDALPVLSNILKCGTVE